MAEPTPRPDPQEPPPAWHHLPVEAVVAHHRTDLARGLSESEANLRLHRYGENAMPKVVRPGPLARFLAQLREPLVLALLAAAAVSAGVAFQEARPEQGWLAYADTLAILAIVFLNALLGVIQEGKAQKALEGLEAMTPNRARVLRDGQSRQGEARFLVPGDVVTLETGDRVPADLRLVESRDARTQEAALTGESEPVAKDAAGSAPPDAPVADRTTVAYLGTTLVTGTARGVVVGTGPGTELGRIGTMMTAREPEPSPLQERLADFSHAILVLCLAISAGLFAFGLAKGDHPWHVLLLTAVSLAVAAIPEGLPAITTITLALGMQRMAGRGAVVRKLSGVESLGSATVICTDKTGTLTANRMTVREIRTPGDSSPGLELLLRAGVLGSTAELEAAPDGTTRVLGDPTEGALLLRAREAGLDPEGLRRSHPVETVLPFDSERKRMAVVTRSADGTRTAWVKGAPEAILPRITCLAGPGDPTPATADDRKAIAASADELAGLGRRVLALAYRLDPPAGKGEDPEDELVFLGLVGLQDPPRPGVAEAIAACQRAGIRVKMITGDHPRTGVAIARELGLWQPDSTVIEGPVLSAMDDTALDRALDRVAVFARVDPAHKLRIVEALSARGEVVAMTGDGVNDAPALRRAPVGVAMGLSGTDVAREAADVVLLDDDFTTIVTAVKEGRTVFANLQKAIAFLLGSNAGLVLAVAISSGFEWMLLLTPLQLLWINLVTNGLPALALGLDPVSDRIMDRPPVPPESNLIDRRELQAILRAGLAMGTAALLAYLLPDLVPGLFPDPAAPAAMEAARTIAFVVLGVAPLLHAFSCRDPRISVFRLGLADNRALLAAVAVSGGLLAVSVLVPSLETVFHTVPLTPSQWAAALALSVLVIPVEELSKALGPTPTSEGGTTR